jgi:hypothetical protein
MKSDCCYNCQVVHLDPSCTCACHEMLPTRTSLRSWLCYYELHVDDRTFVVHVVVEAKTSQSAMNKLKTKRGEHWTLQVKGCLGEVTDDLVKRYLAVKPMMVHHSAEKQRASLKRRQKRAEEL